MIKLTHSYVYFISLITLSIIFWIFPLNAMTITSSEIRNWISATNLPAAIDSHYMVYYNEHLLVVGGRKGGMSTAEVVSAALQPDGSLGGWQQERALATPVYLHAVAVYNHYLYVIGGWDSIAQKRHAEIWRAEILPNGELGDWNAISNYPRSIVLHDATIVGNNIYVIGGMDESNISLTDVYYSTIQPDGNLSGWVKTSNLPKPRSRISVASTNGYIYVAGGYDDTAAQNTVFFAKVKADGSLEEWQTAVNALPIQLYYPEVVIHEGQLVVLGGGVNTDVQFDAIYSAQIQADGSIDRWQLEEAKLPKAMYRLAAVTVPKYESSFIYIAGGNQKGTALSEVYHSDVPTPMSTPTPTVTPTPTKGMAYLNLRSEPTLAIAAGDPLTYIIDYGGIDYPDAEYELTNVVITNIVPIKLELIPDQLPSSDALHTVEYTGLQGGSVITWTRRRPLKDNEQGTVSYQVHLPTATPTLLPTTPPTPGSLQITKKGPAIATPGAPIDYTLMVTNSSLVTVTDVVIIDHIPVGAQYITGGTRQGDLVEWNDIEELKPGEVVQRVYLVRASQTITNSNYSVQAKEIDPIAGGLAVVTLIGDQVLVQPPDNGGVIINQGATIEWLAGEQKGKLKSGPTYNPLYRSYFPYMAR